MGEGAHIQRTERIGTIAAHIAGAVDLFFDHDIDFAFFGHRSLADACAAADCPLPAIVERLSMLRRRGVTESLDALTRELPAIVAELCQPQHGEILDSIATAQELLVGLEQRVPGSVRVLARDLRLTEAVLRRLFASLIHREESLLFPLIRRNRGALALHLVALVQRESLRLRRPLTNHRHLRRELSLSVDTEALPLLERIERNIHEHLHLENNILYPRLLGSWA